MADTMYAWSPIRAGDKSAKVGDTVTAQTLGVSNEDFEAMVDAGAVRNTKPPKMENFSGSVVEWYQRQAREAAREAGGTIDDENLRALHAIGEV
jgi:hypothetical protein